MLSGHERSLTQVKYNAEGDLLFSTSKDHVINVWYSHNGERLGTYNGHIGAVWTCDVNDASTILASGSADNTIKLWDVSTGKCIKTWEYPTAIKRVQFSEDQKRLLAVTEQRMGHAGTVVVHNVETLEDEAELTITFTGSKGTMAGWSFLDKFIVVTHEDGSLSLYDPKNGEQVEHKDGVHSGNITDMQFSEDRTYFITSSRDKTAKIHETSTLTTLKTYVSDTPLNSAAITPLKPFVILGGGQDAMAVTTTSQRQGKFECRFYHRIFEEEVGRVRGHFGPINTIAVRPDGKSYASGGEDGYVRVHHYDESYFKSKLYPEVEL